MTTHPPLPLLTATAAAAAALYLLLLRRAPPLPSIIPSPRTTLAQLSPQDLSQLPYPPDLFPGGRWVSTPYGVIRVYEWGPLDGRKAVFVHGIGTPCCIARDLLWGLVEGGWRVLVFDLYGRGYSDTPTSTPHDARLYSSQILFATSSSPLHWSSFTLLGYSFGGGIAVSFASFFPSLVSGLVLLAPSGILPGSRLGVLARLANAGYVPDAVAAWMAVRRTHKVQLPGTAGVDPRERGTVLDVEAVVRWQGKVHTGYVGAFLGSFRCGPVFDGQEVWRGVGAGLREGGKKALVLVAEGDEVVGMGLVGEMVELLGGGEGVVEGEGVVREGRVVGRVVRGCEHDFVLHRGAELAEMVLDFWR